MRWLANLIDYIGIGLLCLTFLGFIIGIIAALAQLNTDIEQNEKFRFIDFYRCLKFILLAFIWLILQGGGVCIIWLILHSILD